MDRLGAAFRGGDLVIQDSLLAIPSLDNFLILLFSVRWNIDRISLACLQKFSRVSQ